MLKVYLNYLEWTRREIFEDHLSHTRIRYANCIYKCPGVSKMNRPGFVTHSLLSCGTSDWLTTVTGFYFIGYFFMGIIYNNMKIKIFSYYYPACYSQEYGWKDIRQQRGPLYFGKATYSGKAPGNLWGSIRCIFNPQMPCVISIGTGHLTAWLEEKWSTTP